MEHALGAWRWFDGKTLHAGPVRVQVLDGRIARIEEGNPLCADQDWLDPEAILVPGFIDTHSHSDYSIVDDPTAVGALMQGITTQVVGQCGFSAAPLRHDRGHPSTSDDPTYIATSKESHWSTMREYRDTLRGLSLGVNVLPFVGHNTLISAAGTDTSHVLALADLAIDGGARGVSTGLSYHPGRHSPDDQVTALASLAGRRGVPYHTHMRYGPEETLETLERSLGQLRGHCGTVTISHAFPRLRDTRTSVAAILDALDRAAPSFDSLTTDVTVYDTGGTPWSHGLPLWATGGPESQIQVLATDAHWRSRVADHLQREADGWVVDWEGLTVTKVNDLAHRSLLGCTVQQIADGLGVTPETAVLDLLAADGHFWVSPPNKNWRDVLDLLSHDRCIPMVDGITVDPRRDDRLVGLDRSWNSFRRFVETAIPEAPLSLESGLRKLTSDAAERLGLVDRGVISSGAAADFVVLKPEAVSELQGPDFEMADKGIDGVMVNGRWAYRAGSGFADRGAGIVL